MEYFAHGSCRLLGQKNTIVDSSRLHLDAADKLQYKSLRVMNVWALVTSETITVVVVHGMRFHNDHGRLHSLLMVRTFRCLQYAFLIFRVNSHFTFPRQNHNPPALTRPSSYWGFLCAATEIHTTNAHADHTTDVRVFALESTCTQRPQPELTKGKSVGLHLSPDQPYVNFGGSTA